MGCFLRMVRSLIRVTRRLARFGPQVTCFMMARLLCQGFLRLQARSISRGCFTDWARFCILVFLRLQARCMLVGYSAKEGSLEKPGLLTLLGPLLTWVSRSGWFASMVRVSFSSGSLVFLGFCRLRFAVGLGWSQTKGSLSPKGLLCPNGSLIPMGFLPPGLMVSLPRLPLGVASRNSI